VASLNWGAIALGSVSGLGAAMIVGVPLLAAGIADTESFSGEAVLILLGFAAQFVAGWVAARFAGRIHPVHGALAALGAFAAVSAASLAAGADPGPGSLVFGVSVAALLGTAGGVLVEARERAADC
jgi:hypothetical protein